MDGDYVWIAGALSSKLEKCLTTARELGISEDRAYPSWKALLEGEQGLPIMAARNFWLLLLQCCN